MEILQEIEERLSIFNNFYDAIRIIDPIKKEVVLVKGKGSNRERLFGTCYDIWEKGEPCKNCISARAVKETDTLTKIEYIHGRIFLIIATAITAEEKSYAVEIIKELNKETVLWEKMNNSTMEAIINKMNEKAIRDDAKVK